MIKRDIHCKIIAVVGPTASGKSDLAVRLARKFGGEVISADSRQVYRGMDIGTGKITRKEMRGIPHYLLDVASPRSTVTVTQFTKLARKKIGEIVRRNKVPIVVGGTGFWLDALLYDYRFPEVKPDPALRKKLEKKETEDLFRQLQKLDPERAKTVESKNKRRLIRALEIVLISGRPVPILKGEPLYPRLLIGIQKPKQTLDRAIRKRLLAWLRQGLLKEIRKLRESGVPWKRFEALGMEYRFGAQYLRGQISYEEMREQSYLSIVHYAKRQVTWFKRNKEICWISRPEQAFALAKKFLK